MHAGIETCHVLSITAYHRNISDIIKAIGGALDGKSARICPPHECKLVQSRPMKSVRKRAPPGIATWHTQPLGKGARLPRQYPGSGSAQF